ncbi:MAG: hypothetical protein Q9169_004182 [Polycauliona sp. 2 TL-2023]
MDSPPSNPTSDRSVHSPDPIPLDSPLRTYPKRGLPSNLSSTYPHGLLSGHPRTASQQASFNARKGEILNTMSAEQIEKSYLEATEKVKRLLEEDERKGREVDEKIEALKMERATERRAYERLKERRRKLGVSNGKEKISYWSKL